MGMKRKFVTPMLEAPNRPKKKHKSVSFCNSVESSLSLNSCIESCSSVVKSGASSVESYCMSYTSKVGESDRVRCISHKSVVG